MKLKSAALGALAISFLSAAAFAEQIDNPAYQAWSKYRPGTTVTYQSQTQMTMPNMPAGAGKQTTTMTTKLLEVTANKVVTETSTAMTVNGQVMPGTVVKSDVPAKIEKGSEHKDTAGVNTTIKDEKDGNDTVEVMGKKLDTMTRQYTVESNAGGRDSKSTVKVWSSPEIPGGMVKTQMDVTAPITMTTTITLTNFKLEK